MWKRLGIFVIQYRMLLLLLLLVASALIGYRASKVTISYEFSRAVPTDNAKYLEYQAFLKKFGSDGELVFAGVQTPKLFELPVYQAYASLMEGLKKVTDVQDVLCVPSSLNLVKDSATERLKAMPIFPTGIKNQEQLDSARAVFFGLPFYQTLLYNPQSNAFVMAVTVKKVSMNSVKRSMIVAQIQQEVDRFEQATGIDVKLSGLPLIRTVVADKIQREMRFFLLGSLALSALILLLFFRSVSNMLLSLTVVILGVVWSMGILELCGYKITLLTALIPPLVVVIGIPNCIYFINKYHTAFLGSSNKHQALVDMVSKMGVVTLFCNLTAGIGFAVFALTKSQVLQEFGVVAGISIMMIFIISFILLPAVLSFLPEPQFRQTRYLNNRFITQFLLRIETWVVHHQKIVVAATVLILMASVAGIFKLKTITYVVDDLPHTDQVYRDLQFFEKEFRGVLPLEILIDSKKRNGIAGARALTVFAKVDSLAQYIQAQPEMNRPLSLAEGLKFAKQAFYEGDSSNYQLPNAFDGAFVGEYLRSNKNDSSSESGLAKTLASFMDTARQVTRMSINMADVGTKRLPEILQGVEKRTGELFDTAQYRITYTGSSITFLEGSQFIINGLKESIAWAFLLIALCMLYLFKSVRILLCSLLPNLIPLVITAGVMGWVGVPLKPSTVLVFSVALGIAIDVTIRFLVNYKQELSGNNNNVASTVKATINQTGLSIVYTSLVLVAGFIIFCFSGFGGTQALGWLTSVTLLVATLTNLVLLPVLLLWMAPSNQQADK